MLPLELLIKTNLICSQSIPLKNTCDFISSILLAPILCSGSQQNLEIKK